MLNHGLGIVKAVNCVTTRILDKRCPTKYQNLLCLLVDCQSSVPPRTRPKTILADAVPRPRWDIENYQIVKTSLLWVLRVVISPPVHKHPLVIVHQSDWMVTPRDWLKISLHIQPLIACDVDLSYRVYRVVSFLSSLSPCHML